MKKILLITIFLFLHSNPLHALSNAFWDAIYDGCYSGSEKTKFWRSYCTCYTNKFTEIYNDEQLIVFLNQNEGKDLSKNPLVKRFARECIDQIS